MHNFWPRALRCLYTGPKICEKSCGLARHAVRSPWGPPRFCRSLARTGPVNTPWASCDHSIRSVAEFSVVSEITRILTYEKCTGQARAPHESHTGHARAHLCPARSRRNGRASVHNPSRRTHGPVCPARCPYVRLTDLEECSDWLLRSRGQNIVETCPKPVELPQTSQQLNFLRTSHGYGPVRPSKSYGPVTTRKSHVTVASDVRFE